MTKPSRKPTLVTDELRTLITEAEETKQDTIAKYERAEVDGTLGALARSMPTVQEQLAPHRRF